MTMIDETFAPIATAPRDGTFIVVGHEEVGTFMMRFVADQKNEFFAPGQVGMWLEYGDFMTWIDDPELGPSHWRPFNGDKAAVN
jgi:hypothetical protein